MSPSPTQAGKRRPAAVQAFNRAGHLLEKTGLLRLRLEEDSLLKAAMEKTGLTDFGDEQFRIPLRRLIDSLNREARLNTVGKVAARQEILQLLINRLHIEADRIKYPAIAAQVIESPLFIIGLPRTGTTLLHSLLAEDPDNRLPLTWEIMYPSPPTERDEKKRIARTQKNMAWLDRLAPEFKAIHLAGALLPQECVAIMSHVFISDEFDVLFNVPEYRYWAEKQDMRFVYAYHHRFLQHLQHRKPGRHWVLKAPSHMLGMEALFEIYPDARIVQTHREPLEVMASTASLSTVLRGTFSDYVDPALIGRETSEFWAEMLESFMQLRANRSPRQFFDLSYEEIVRDPIDAVRRMYLHFGNTLTPETERRMRDFLACHPQDKHGRHRYTMEQFGIDPAEESPRFDRYRKRFNIPAPTIPQTA